MTQAPQAMPQQTVLICTLGTAPAVVTVTLDPLIQRKAIPFFDEIVVLYTRQVSGALATVNDALMDPRYTGRVKLPLQTVRLERDGIEIDDVRREEDAEAILRALYRTVEAQKRLETLSPRERDVLMGVVAGKANKIIAFELNISARTVEVYRANLMSKTGARNLSDLMRLALTAGL